MLIFGFSGCEIDEHSPVVQWLKGDGLGGVLLFDLDLVTHHYGKNLKNREQIMRLNNELNRYARLYSLHDSLPLFIAIDYEGGVVDGLSRIAGCMRTKQPAEQSLLTDDDLYEEAGKMAETLHELGFNLNFAPVVDLSLNEQQGIIGTLGRSFSAKPAEVIRAARQFVNAFNKHNVVCAYKHFPGHGSACGDTHLGFVDVTERYQDQELLPYATLLHSDNATQSVMVMTAHVINRQLDASGLPATLSHAILTQLLREKLGFDGVIVSDDMQMQAISQHYSLDESLRLTINAGADMMIFSNQWGDITPTEIIDRIEGLVQSGAVDLMRIDDAYRRICLLKALNTHGERNSEQGRQFSSIHETSLAS